MTNKLHLFDRSIINNSYISRSESYDPPVTPSMDTYKDVVLIHDSQLFDLPEEVHNHWNYVFHDRLNALHISISYLWEAQDKIQIHNIDKPGRVES